ncbi:hypothetical protein EBS02_05280, partial [bacterium]|nr:hypothetical protein [bacterium]
KKTIILYTPGAGAESMAYLKPFFITPGAFLLTGFFLSLSMLFTRAFVFYTIVSLFTAYFALYSFLLNPFQEIFALNAAADFLMAILPQSFQAAPALIRYWMHTLFYTSADLWGTTVVSLLVWGLANDISTHDEAKFTYPLFTIAIGTSGILAGKLSGYFSKIPYNPDWPIGATQWDQCFLRIMLAVLVFCFITLTTYRMLLLNQFHQHHMSPLAEKEVIACKSHQKKQHSLRECLTLVFRSKNLLYITVVVLSYNIVYTLSDFIFLKRVGLAFSVDHQGDSNAFLSDVAMYTSITATIFSLFVNNLSLRYAGWTATALITPMTFILTGSLFYFAQIEVIAHSQLFAGIDALNLSLYAGVLHITLLRGTRYSVFDTTKEMAYIGLTAAERLNGKAVIDGIVSRFGRSGGSVILFVLFAVAGNSLIATIPYVFFIVLFLTILWFRAVLLLSRTYHFSLQRHVHKNIDMKEESVAI